MPRNPEVSFLMPAYNEIEHIDAAVLSVLAESHQDWELIISDDRSEDGTFERAKFWAGMDDRIRAMQPHVDHGHFIENCNIMLDEAKGDLIARLDADDMTLPHRLETEIDFLKRTESAIYIGGLALALMEEEGHKLTPDYPWLRDVVYPSASETQPVNDKLRYTNPIVHSSVLTWRSELVRTGGYDDLAPSEDWDMALMLARKGDVYVLPNLLCIKRQHATNLTRVSKEEGEAAFRALRKKHDLPIENRIRTNEASTALDDLEID